MKLCDSRCAISAAITNGHNKFNRVTHWSPDPLLSAYMCAVIRYPLAEQHLPESVLGMRVQGEGGPQAPQLVIDAQNVCNHFVMASEANLVCYQRVNMYLLMKEQDCTLHDYLCHGAHASHSHSGM